MSRPYRVLLVAPLAKLVDALTAWLAPAGYEVIVASSFNEAKGRLDEHPDLLMTAVKLGEYNGLHLALRAGADHIPTIVIGQADCVLARDAQQLGATYLSSTLRRRDLLSLVRRLSMAGALPPSDHAGLPEVRMAVRAPFVTA